ncbi:hypothetical protein CASFOL_001529 [Castilleja foliolosa]|uniref:Uncharacterized protein n=1 Tax=Castilleja foliolosa TaxID=1961234 RepID=A0ABD3EN90_9LAMI
MATAARAIEGQRRFILLLLETATSVVAMASKLENHNNSSSLNSKPLADGDGISKQHQLNIGYT